MGESLKAIRERRGLTKVFVAKEVGVHFNTIANWEQGNSEPDASHLKKLAILLECDVEELIDFDVA